MQAVDYGGGLRRERWSDGGATEGEVNRGGSGINKSASGGDRTVAWEQDAAIGVVVLGGRPGSSFLLVVFPNVCWQPFLLLLLFVCVWKGSSSCSPGLVLFRIDWLCRLFRASHGCLGCSIVSLLCGVVLVILVSSPLPLSSPPAFIR